MTYPKFFQQWFTCAYQDIVFAIKFINEGTQENPKYHIYSYKTPRSRIASDIIEGATATENLKIEARYFNCEDFSCPICEAGQRGGGNTDVLVLCGTCRRYVCIGNSDVENFRCTDDCGGGSPWERVGMMEIVDGREDRSSQKRFGQSGSNRLRLEQDKTDKKL